MREDRRIEWRAGFLVAVLVALVTFFVWTASAESKPPDRDTNRKATVCHGRSGNVRALRVGSRAVQAHLRHGDALPGDAVPDMPGFRYDDNCDPVPLPTPPPTPTSPPIPPTPPPIPPVDGFGTITFTLYSDSETPNDPEDDVPIQPPDWSGEWNLRDGNGVRIDSGDASPSGTIPDVPTGTYWLAAVANEHPEVLFGPFDVVANTTTDLGILVLFDTLSDLDGDGYPDHLDCAPADPLWTEFADSGTGCALEAWTLCDSFLRVQLSCLPPIADVNAALGEIGPEMLRDKHTWDDRNGVQVQTRPGDSYGDGEHHLQSIQYFDTFTPGYPQDDTYGRYLVSTLAAGQSGEPAVQLVQTGLFGSEAGETDWIAEQLILTGRFDHPGGSQMLGEYLFVALEETDPAGEPATGVFRIRPQNVPGERIEWLYSIPLPAEGAVPAGDRHHGAVAATRLGDGTFLVAACVYKDCDVINFYKSLRQQLDYEESPGNYAPDFQFVDQWQRSELLPGNPGDAGCSVQNLSFVPDDDGTLYLVEFGSSTADPNLPEFPGPLVKLDPARHPICGGLVGYDEHLYAYEVSMTGSFDITLGSGTSFDVMGTALEDIDPTNLYPYRHVCAWVWDPLIGEFGIPTRPPIERLHGLNFPAAAGLWFGPGPDELAIIVSEHFDTCDSPWEVNGKTRWAVSANAFFD